MSHACASNPTHGTYRIIFAHGRAKNRSLYSLDEADFIATVVYYDTTTAVYIIPVDAVKAMKGVFFDVGKHPRYPDKWPVCKWEEYRGRWDLLNDKS